LSIERKGRSRLEFGSPIPGPLFVEMTFRNKLETERGKVRVTINPI